MVWRREIGDLNFVEVNEPISVPRNGNDNSSVEVPSVDMKPLPQKRKVDSVWVLIVLLLVLVLALFIYDVFKNYGEVRNDRNGEVLTGDKLHVENSETNRVSRGAVSLGQFKKRH